MNILLLGKTGLLGAEFLRILQTESRENSSIQFWAPDKSDFNVLDFEEVDDVLTDNFFDLIINCVAYTKVDQAEIDKHECYALNVEALENLVRYQIPLIHFSSDYVFSAKKTDKITENFPRQPLNYYGETKYQAEIFLENFAGKYWNIRTSWLFGENRDNFVTNILKQASTGKIPEVVDDEFGRPTAVSDLAEYVFKEFVVLQKPVGNYHLQNSGPIVSWADLADFVLQTTTDNLKHSKLDLKLPKQVKRISEKFLNRPAQRPQNSVLINTKLKNSLPNWQTSLRSFLKFK